MVIGLNSTALLESKLCEIPVLIPLFKEAKEKYFDTNVYFQNYLDVFTIANDPNDILNIINDVINGSKLVQKNLPKKMIHDYIGYFDGNACNRIVNIMKDEINKLNKRDLV